MTAKFITFEGTEGVGKTTAIDNICQKLEEHHIAFIRTREPGGSDFAENCRQLLLNTTTKINVDSELLLVFSARIDHLQKVILPALAQNKWVICDRFIDSTIAYQGFGGYHGDKQQLQKINLLIENFILRLPDLTFWLDLDPKIGLVRAKKRSQADRFEQNNEAFFERVYQGFYQQYQDDGKNAHQRITRINANQTPKKITDDIWQTLKSFANLK